MSSFAALAASASMDKEPAAAPVATPAQVKDPDFVVNLDGIDPEKLVSKPLTEVQLDAMVVLKIIKHCRDNYPITTYGQLLGTDIAGVLEVTNCFPVVSRNVEEDNEKPFYNERGQLGGEMDGAEYQLRMLRCLRKLNYDASSVGLYVSTHLGSFWNQTIIENQFNYQRTFSQSVLIVYDPTRTSQGNLSLRALRLTDAFMELFKERKFTMESLQAQGLTADGIFESLPITVRNSKLLNVLLHQLEDSPTDYSDVISAPSGTFNALANLIDESQPSIFSPNLEVLDLDSDTYLERHLEYLSETVDEYGQEQWRWQGWQRSVSKEQARSAAMVARRRQENANRLAAGLSPAYTEEEVVAPSPALAKLLVNEPSRLETLVITNQIDTYCKQIHQFTGPALTKMYLAKAVSRSK